MANFNAIKLDLKTYYDSLSIQTAYTNSPSHLIDLTQQITNRPREGQLYPRNTN